MFRDQCKLIWDYESTKTKQNYENDDRLLADSCLTKGPTDKVEEFTYLGSVISITGGSEQDVEAILGNAKTVGDG